MFESKRFEELFCSVHVWIFFRKEGGWGYPIPNFLRNFSACVLKSFRKGGRGLPCSKTFEELFCFSLDIFQEEGGCLIPKMIRYIFLLWVTYFPRKIGEDDPNPNTLRFLKSSSKRSKNTGGRVKAVWKKSKQKHIFSSDGFP